MTKHAVAKEVIIYGGGIAGIMLAKQLSDSVNVTLVDPNAYFEIPMATPRSLVTPEFAKKAIIPFSEAVPKARHIQGKLIQLSQADGLVQLHDGQQIKLQGNVTVLATGNTFSNPLMRAFESSAQERQNFYVRYSQQLETSTHILIVGGGPIGVEVAGEITESYPEKLVTILESGPRLLSGTTAAASQAAAVELTNRGVTVIVDEKLVSADSQPTEVFTSPGIAITSRGRKIAYDLIIWCIGGKPNTSYMNPYLSSALNHQNRIKVSPKLRVADYQTVFALGDITDLDENKMAWHIEGQVKKAEYNIRQVLAGHTEDQHLKTYKAQTGNPKMAVTLGTQQGVLYLPVIGVITCPALTSIAKSSHMLVPKFRKALDV